jgi:hypothetical protein
MRMLPALYLLLGICCSIHTAAADSLMLLRTVPISARLMQADELGNAYVVSRSNELIRYTPAGDSSTNFKSVANGDIGYIDVTNPLRILVYYPDFNKLVLLDRMLSLKNELNLRKLNLVSSSLVAVSADANLWVYDQFNAVLNKLDLQLNYMIRGNDLRQQLAELPAPVFMTERERKVYIADTTKGILVFDQYGTYINTLSIPGIKQLQISGPRLIYRRQDTLLSYDLQQFSETAIQIPHQNGEEIISTALCRNVLYVLYADRLSWYAVKEI